MGKYAKGTYERYSLAELDFIKSALRDRIQEAEKGIADPSRSEASKTGYRGMRTLFLRPWEVIDSLLKQNKHYFDRIEAGDKSLLLSVELYVELNYFQYALLQKTIEEYIKTLPGDEYIVRGFLEKLRKKLNDKWDQLKNYTLQEVAPGLQIDLAITKAQENLDSEISEWVKTKKETQPIDKDEKNRV